MFVVFLVFVVFIPISLSFVAKMFSSEGVWSGVCVTV